MKFKMLKWVFICFTLLSAKSFSQCFEIESILVDACAVSGPEGKNEMVRFKVGATALNTSNMSVTWPSNSWQGLIQNSTTASSVSQLNAEVVSSGGCGTIIEPTGGVLPANATVVLVTSHQFEVAANYFGAITEDIYILFQNNSTVTAGHFVNYNATPGLRTLIVNFGGCSDSVTYDRSLLVNASGVPGSADGATVNFSSSGIATYANYGCQAPVEVISVDAGGGSSSSMTACQGATISLNGSGVGIQSVLWSASSGTFSNDSSYTSTYTLDSSVTGSVVLTLIGTGSCSNTVFDTITINITPQAQATFASIPAQCANGSNPLPTTSQEGFTGTWSPAFDANTSGSYVFTPDTTVTGQECALPSAPVAVTITPQAQATFASIPAQCANGSNPLPTTSQEGFTGTWSPAFDANTSGSYVFTPNTTVTGQECALPSAPVAVTINVEVQATFNLITLCVGDSNSALPTTSLEGFTGVWNATDIDTSTSGIFTYDFTVTAGQCALDGVLNVEISAAQSISFDGVEVCSGSVVDFPTVTAEGYTLTGTWSSSTITTTTNSTYTFTPSDTCYGAGTFEVVVNGCTIPKGFSPNGDGNNDTWDLSSFNIKKVEVFNRYGLKVYSKRNYVNEWGGKSDNGNELPTGTYYYMIDFEDRPSVTGWVYINRGE